MKQIHLTFWFFLLLTACLKETPIKNEYSGFEPITLNDGWMISSPEQEGVNSSQIEEAYRQLYAQDRFLRGKSLIVVRNGKIIAEAYPSNDNHRNELNNIQSCTKSVTSMLLGIAIHQGFEISEDELLFSYIPELFDSDVRKQQIKIKDALTMQTGLTFDNSKHTRKLYQTSANSGEFVLSQSYQSTPGATMHYNDGAPQLISKLIEQKSGVKMTEFALHHLFNPLSITEWYWECAKDSTAFGAFSLYLKPRDLMKLGQLLLQNGNWNNNQIINPSYLEKATSSITPTNLEYDYGYYFWIDSENDGYFAFGQGGQMMYMLNPSPFLGQLFLILSCTNRPFWFRSTTGLEALFQFLDAFFRGCKNTHILLPFDVSLNHRLAG